MSGVSIEQVGDIRCAVGESPLWSVRDAAWYWVDIPAKRLWKLDAGGASRYWELSEMAGCVTQAADGSFLAGMETGLFRLQLGQGSMPELEERLACPAELGPGMRFNDGKCDRQGRYWAGTMVMDMSLARPDGALYRFGRDGLAGPFVPGLITQNGLAFSPDGRTMYLSDSHPQRRLIWAFDYDPASGTPSNQRLFVDMNQQRGRPDGGTVDADGCYWITGNDGGCLLRFTPEGKLDRTIELPFLKPSMCSFGGPRLDTLLVTSIPSGKPEDPQGGVVVTLQPGVQGIAETPALA
jgi:sugar lactone lactonase YvrE